MEISKELAASVIGLLVANAFAGIAWMFKLGGRVMRAEDKITTMVETHASDERRISRLEESHASSGNRLIALETELGNIKSLLIEALSILRKER